METPSSLRMIARSQKAKQEGSRTNPERSALLDITNDSPIVGLATAGDLSENTPSAAKSRGPAKNTPGSGEALLRWQVRTLLQKVEEDGEGEFLKNKLISSANRLSLWGLPGPSPTQILAPTPANTPEILNLSAVGPILMDAVEEEEEEGLKIDSLQDEQAVEIHAEESLVNRALLFDSPGKSESSNADSSTLTYQGSTERSTDDDNSSAWSMQVNQQVDDYDDVDDIEEFDEEEEDECYDELCEELSKMSVHSRFVYDSDDEIIEREEIVTDKISSDVLLLKGMPVPEGKHIRFHQEEDEEEGQ